MSKQEPDSGKFMSSVKVGPKGQIVIPKEAREMFGIEPGNVLLLLADSSRGIAIQRMDVFDKLADDIFSGAAMAGKTAQEREQELRFARSVKNAGQEPENPE